MKKLFISPLMDGKTDEEFLKERKNAIKSAEKILKEPVEVIDLIFQAGSDTANKPLWFISESLKLLSTADIAYFPKGWEGARACRVEHACAVEYGIAVIEDYKGEKYGTEENY